MNTLLGIYENLIDYFKGESLGVRLALFGIMFIFFIGALVSTIKSYKVDKKFKIKIPYVVLTVLFLAILIFFSSVMFR